MFTNNVDFSATTVPRGMTNCLSKQNFFIQFIQHNSQITVETKKHHYPKLKKKKNKEVKERDKNGVF